MPNPATSDDVIRLARAVEGLEQRLNHAVSDIVTQVKLIDQNLNAALSAMGDERVDNESNYQSKLIKYLEETNKELKSAFSQIREYMIQAEIEYGKIQRAMANYRKNGRR